MNIHIEKKSRMDIYRLEQWVGRVIVLPVPYDKKAVKEQINCQGVYILLGERDDDSRNPVVYVGMADNSVFERWNAPGHPIKDGNYKKAVVITSKVSFFAKYLEGRILADIADSKKMLDAWTEDEKGATIDIRNRQNSVLRLDEISKVIMEDFYAEWKVLIPILGLDGIFNVTTAASSAEAVKEAEPGATENKPPIFILRDAKGDIYDATMKIINGKFVVQRGSKCRRDWTAEAGLEKYKSKREELIKLEALKDDGKYLVFQQDYEFEFTSEPASIIMTGSVSGPAVWKLNGSPDMPYKKWLEEKQD